MNAKMEWSSTLDKQAALFTNCQLLGYEDQTLIWQNGFSTFCNTQACQKVFFFLFSKLQPNCEDFDQCWPITEKGQDREFREVISKKLQDLMNKGAISHSRSLKSTLATYHGQRILDLLLDLSEHILGEVHRRKYPAVLPVKLVEVEAAPNVSSLLDLTMTQLLEKDQLLRDIVAGAELQQKQFEELAKDLVQELDSLEAQELSLRADGMQETLLVPETMKAKITEAKMNWESLDNFFEKCEALSCGALEDIVHNREHRYQLSEKNLKETALKMRDEAVNRDHSHDPETPSCSLPKMTLCNAGPVLDIAKLLNRFSLELKGLTVPLRSLVDSTEDDSEHLLSRNEQGASENKHLQQLQLAIYAMQDNISDQQKKLNSRLAELPRRQRHVAALHSIAEVKHEALSADLDDVEHVLGMMSGAGKSLLSPLPSTLTFELPSDESVQLPPTLAFDKICEDLFDVAKLFARQEESQEYREDTVLADLRKSILKEARLRPATSTLPIVDFFLSPDGREGQPRWARPLSPEGDEELLDGSSDFNLLAPLSAEDLAIMR